MGNFHSDPVKDMGSHENLLNLMMCFKNSTFVKIKDFVYLCWGEELFVMY